MESLILLEVFTESSKKKSESEVTVELKYQGKRTTYQGWVTTTKFGEKWAAKRNPVMRFFFDSDLLHNFEESSLCLT